MSDEFVDVYDTEPEGTKASWRNPFEEVGAESAGEPSGRVRRAAAPASARERTASTDEVEKALALILERERDVLVAAMLDPSERTAEALLSSAERRGAPRRRPRRRRRHVLPPRPRRHQSPL